MSHGRYRRVVGNDPGGFVVLNAVVSGDIWVLGEDNSSVLRIIYVKSMEISKGQIKIEINK